VFGPAQQEVVKEVLRRLGRAAEQASAYKDIAGPEWGPRLAALVCCAHFLNHHLREGPAPLLLLDLQVRPGRWRLRTWVAHSAGLSQHQLQ
jgi:hypothetical protein